MIKWLFLCFITCVGFAAEPVKKSICLNMIVRDEAPVIARCLQSIKPLIDYWVIVDTGSKDGTQKVIKEFMSDVPGELHEQTWVNFGHNRNEALKLAKGKGDYVLFIDADEELEGGFDKNQLDGAVYLATTRTARNPPLTFLRTLLINNHLDWSWNGILHEKLTCVQETPILSLQGVVVSAESKDGHRSQDPQKYLKDAYTLEKALIDEPNNADYAYYLAQSYYNADKLQLALDAYQKRAKMDGWDQHTFWSKYISGQLQERLGMDFEIFVKSYCDAFHFRPTRAEPLCRLALHYYNQKNYILGYALAQLGMAMPVPADIVYVEGWIYSYGLLGVFANCAMELGKSEEASIAYGKFAEINDAPDFLRKQALSTKKFLDEKKQVVKK